MQNSSMNRVPPYNTEAEQCTLGSILISRDAYDEIADPAVGLHPADFYREAHTVIYQAVAELYAKGEPVDIVTVQDALDARKMLDAVGGAEYLAALIDTVPTAANAAYYAKIVRDKAIRRQWIDHAARLQAQAHDEGADLDSIAMQAHEGDMAISGRTVRGEWTPFSEAVLEAYGQIETAYETGTPIRGIQSGIPALDEITLGWFNSDLVILAARPSVGKTAMALQWAEVAAEAGYPVAIFSVEMAKTALAMRSIQAASGMSGYALRNPQFGDDCWARVVTGVGKLSGLPIYINDTPRMTHTDMQVQARRAVQKYGVKLIMLDYAQLVEGPRSDSRSREVGAVARAMKATARELEIPFIALSQLSRKCEAEKREPQLSDLRDSGEVEQEADGVLFLHRIREGEDSILIKIAKWRQLRTGRAYCRWVGHIMRFVPEDHAHEDFEERRPYADD